MQMIICSGPDWTILYSWVQEVKNMELKMSLWLATFKGKWLSQLALSSRLPATSVPSRWPCGAIKQDGFSIRAACCLPNKCGDLSEKPSLSSSLNLALLSLPVFSSSCVPACGPAMTICPAISHFSPLLLPLMKRDAFLLLPSMEA